MPPLPMARNDAETLGARMLGWMAEDDDRFGRFLATTGMGLADIKQRAGDPEFLGFVIDFLLSDEATLMACCEALAIAPDQPMRARAALPGGDLPHWT